MKKRKLTLWIHEPSEMAKLCEGRWCLYYGNFWDFHSGCHGPEVFFADGTTIDFSEEWQERYSEYLHIDRA